MVFALEEDRDAEEDLQAGRDCRQVAAGRCFDLAGSERMMPGIMRKMMAFVAARAVAVR